MSGLAASTGTLDVYRSGAKIASGSATKVSAYWYSLAGSNYHGATFTVRSLKKTGRGAFGELVGQHLVRQKVPMPGGGSRTILNWPSDGKKQTSRTYKALTQRVSFPAPANPTGRWRQTVRICMDLPLQPDPCKSQTFG